MKNSFFHYLLFILQKSKADFLSEARRGYLGVLWWIVEPILYMLVFYVIFVLLFEKGGVDTVNFLLVGLVAWKWFATSIPQCAVSIASNAGLIRQVYVPKVVFPGMVLLTATIKFFIIFSILVCFLFIVGVSPSITWVYLPFVMFVQLMFMASVGIMVAAVVPFVPDFRLLVDNLIMMMFFLSGVFFDISSSVSQYKEYLYVNPMVGIIEAYRKIMLDGLPPDFILLFKVTCFSIIGLAIGGGALIKYDRVYPKVI